MRSIFFQMDLLETLRAATPFLRDNYYRGEGSATKVKMSADIGPSAANSSYVGSLWQGEVMTQR